MHLLGDAKEPLSRCRNPRGIFSRRRHWADKAHLSRQVRVERRMFVRVSFCFRFSLLPFFFRSTFCFFSPSVSLLVASADEVSTRLLPGKKRKEKNVRRNLRSG